MEKGTIEKKMLGWGFLEYLKSGKATQKFNEPLKNSGSVVRPSSAATW